MAFPSTPIIDDFNSGSGSLGGDARWNDDLFGEGDASLYANNRAEPTDLGGGDHIGDGYTVASYGPDCEARYTFTGNGVHWQELYLRLQAVGNLATIDGYVISNAEPTNAPNDIRLSEMTNGSFNQIDSDITQTIAVGDKMGIRVVGVDAGEVIEVWFDDGGAGWGVVHTTQDGTHDLAGPLGFFQGEEGQGSGQLGRGFDDFGGGNFVPPVVPSGRPSVLRMLMGSGRL